MLIVNDEQRLRAGIGSLSKRCQYCSKALAAYPSFSQMMPGWLPCGVCRAVSHRNHGGSLHLLHHARFRKADLKASFSPAFLFAHVAVAVGGMAEHGDPSLLCGMSLASPTAFENLRSFLFGNHPLDEAPKN